VGFNWKKVGQAQVFGRGKYLKDGEYKLKLLKMYTIETRKKGAALIVDFLVMESSNDEIKEGTKRNWYQGLQDKDIAFPAVKEFMQALYDVNLEDSEEVEEFEDNLDGILEKATLEKWQNLDDKKHPLHGKTIAVECYTKETKNGQDFTVHTWSPWDGED
jgi:hypothetical protein